MCTALTYKKEKIYYGRNMDLDNSFNEEVVITPRNYKFNYKNGEIYQIKFSMIGMATVINNYPLYAEAINERGLFLAGLNFPKSAKFKHLDKLDKYSITPYELFPAILGMFDNISDVKNYLKDINIVDVPFMKGLDVASLHWICADENDNSIVVECVDGKMNVYDNPVGVLTNNPPFPYHLQNLNIINNLTNINPTPTNYKDLILINDYVGAGAIGLPGDYSSPSRFLKVFFGKKYSFCDPKDENSCVSELFHILDSVCMVKGCVKTGSENYDITRYSSVLTKQCYYYKTYSNNRICKVNFDETRKSSSKLELFKLEYEQDYRTF